MTEAPYVTIRSRRPVGEASQSRNASGSAPSTATHDISRTSFHVKHISNFAHTLEESASRAFPNRGGPSQRYKKVHALLLHWTTDDLFVLPELEDLEKCLREDYAFETEIFPVPADNAHLELMMRIGQLIKEHESQDTLFIIYYGGHARIDEARQSRWCATRNPDSPWLQWSAIQTLLERSMSDILILLDCCAGAASATFSSGNSTTETISASSWDAIAPDPGRYSFTNALLEVLQEWRHRTFSAAMLHAEVLARLKHPRPITINGKYFEARSTPVHFMMTSDHRAPSIEISRIRSCESPPVPGPLQASPVLSSRRPATPAYEPVFVDSSSDEAAVGTPESTSAVAASVASEPNEDTPHVMISLALEDDQRLDLNAWEGWLASFPALAKYVKVQGVFKSHSNLLLLSMPVMIWDLLPEDQATSFVAFIRSNNLAMEKPQQRPVTAGVAPTNQHETRSDARSESVFFDDNTTITPSEVSTAPREIRPAAQDVSAAHNPRPEAPPAQPSRQQMTLARQPSSVAIRVPAGTDISHTPIYNQHRSARRTTFGDNVPQPPNFAKHIENRLEDYYQQDSHPSDGYREFIASNLGIEAAHVEAWYHSRREQDVVKQQLELLKLNDKSKEARPGPRTVLPGHLSELLELALPDQVLLIDLRTRTDFDRSHIHGAVHLRAPASFLREAPLETIEAALTDDQSRRSFSTWPTARCIVFYARALESPLECPAAEILPGRLAARGWDGDVYLLKGHYREFSASFGKHIGGARMSEEGREYAGVLRRRTVSKERVARSEGEYRVWREAREAEDVGTGAHPPIDEEKRGVMERQERELEVAFHGRFPHLYPSGDKAGRAKDDFGETEAQMVSHLDRGLTKMREASHGPPATPERAPGHEKVVEGPRRRRSSEEFVEVGRERHEAGVGEGEQTGRGGGLISRVFRRG